MKKFFLLLAIIFLFVTQGIAQVGINSDNSAPDNSAMLDVRSTSRGLLLPRMTQQQIESIQDPANGLQVYCTTDGNLYIFVEGSGQWKVVAYGTGMIYGNCGNLTISHVEGDVAPVSKMVTYTTVRGVPGEPSKCWITSNLGSDHQATAVSDASEQSAGWYWQFNRKQGYKHDGTTRTPNTTWIASISDNSNWTATNDPCNIELGAAWRIPTYTEWNNVDNSGAWITWNGPWGSGLKLHAAGYLFSSNGSLILRSTDGVYWGSTQTDSSNGRTIYFNSGTSYTSSHPKAYGFSARCIRDY